MIRLIQPQDYPFLKEMLYEALYVRKGQSPFPLSILETPEIQKYIQNFGRKGDLGLVIEKDNKLIGAVWCRLFTINKPGYGFIDTNTPELTIALQPAYQNNGIGTKLMQAFLQLVQTRGFTQISLSADQESPVISFYLRLGFKIIIEEGTALTMLKQF